MWGVRRAEDESVVDQAETTSAARPPSPHAIADTGQRTRFFDRVTGRAVDIVDLQSQAPFALGLLFLGGGTLVSVSAPFPGRSNGATALAVGIGAVLVGLLLLRAGNAVGTRTLSTILGLGTVLVSILVGSSGAVLSPDALLYVWVGLYSGAFFSRRSRVLHVMFVLLCFGIVLAATVDLDDGESSGGSQAILLLVGAVGVASAWVGHLRTVIDRLIDDQRDLARTDGLTGLPNRSELIDRGEKAVRAGENAVLVLVDLDGFKQVNDTMGHVAGDELLCAVAGRIRSAVRSDDLVARLAGDEFAVLSASTEGIDLIAERIVSAVRAPMRIADEVIHISASVGVVELSDQSDIDSLLADADLAMYDAKAEGGRWLRFEHGMRSMAAERRTLTGELRAAIDAQQFTLRFQPIIDLETGRIASVEALVRWEHPTKGTVPPDAFIPLAETTGLIVPLGRWVLDDACRVATTWTTTAPPAVTVNLSPRQLLDDQIIHDVAASLEEHSIDPKRLVIEITETAVMSDPDTAIQRLSALRELGVGLSIDDFGTGYSSLEYLRRLPASTLKLARPFVRDLHDDPANEALASGIIGLAHTLGKHVVAEGIETVEQRDALCAMECDFAQGYLFDRPLEEQLIAERIHHPTQQLVAGHASLH